MKHRRALFVLLFVVVLGSVSWRLFYTDKRAPTSPVEVPLAWLDEKTLLTGAQDSLFIRKNGENRQVLLSLDGEEFNFDRYCISDANFWFSTWRIETTDDGHGQEAGR